MSVSLCMPLQICEKQNVGTTHYEVGMLAMMAGRPLSLQGWMICAGVGRSA